jgi:hypothetical protein
MNYIIRNMNKNKTATCHQTFKYNKTFSFYVQYVFDRIIFILPGQLTGAAVDLEVVDAEVVVVVVVVELCMRTPWARTARIMEANVHSMVGGRTGTETLGYQRKFFSSLSLFTSGDFPPICRHGRRNL